MIDYTYLENTLLPARFCVKMSGIDTENVRLIEKQNQIEQISLDAKRSAIVQTKKWVFSRGLRDNGFAGFGMANEMVLAKAGEVPFSKEFIIELYRKMTAGDSLNECYRTTEWNGELHRVYPVIPENIDAKLQEICDAYQTAAVNRDIHPILLVTCVLQDFLLLAPFENGNYFLAELIARFLLMESGYDVVMYRPCRLDEKNPTVLRLLRDADAEWGSDKISVPFLEHILYQLADAYRNQEAQLIAIKETRVLKRERIEAVIMGSNAPITKAEICERLPDVSETTIEAQLAVMCKKGQIARLGTRRNSVYVKRKWEEKKDE